MTAERSEGVPAAFLSPSDDDRMVARPKALTGQQRILLQALEDQSPDLGRMYLGGLVVLDDASNPDRFAQCSHSMRELMEKLPEFLDVSTKAQRESLKMKVRELEDAFVGMQKKTDCLNATNRWEGTIEDHLGKLLLKLGSFFEWFSSHHPRRRHEFQTVLVRLDGTGRALPQPLTSLNVDAWEGMRDSFVSVAHHRLEANEPEFLQQMDALERFLLDRLVPRTFDDFAEIDALLEEDSEDACPEKVSKALEQIRKRPANHEYFFTRLSSPDWIAPLDAAELFASPPAAVREGDMISFPFWPESQYLVRMARRAPDQVAAVIAKIPTTDNMRVHGDLAKAAVELPSSLAAKWAKAEATWVAQQGHLYLLHPETLGELVEYLSKAGESDAALELARALLAVRLVDDPPRSVRARFALGSYEQVLQKHVPSLVRRAGPDGLSLLCDVLDSALSEDSDEGANGDDYSWIWRPAIEAHKRNRVNGGIRDALVDAVRDNALAMVEHGVGAQEVLRLLEGRRRPIFRRIALHIARMKHQVFSDAAVQAATDKRNFEDARACHEYSLLLSTVFHKLGPEHKALVLNWIDDGPGIELLDASDPELRRKQKAYWQAQRLCGLRDALPDEWKDRYQHIVAEVGEPEHSDVLSYTSIWSGPASPKDAHELEQMSSNDIAILLKTWQPTHAWQTPTPEGLGRALQSVVGKCPERFAGNLDAFRHVDPTYARSIVHGLSDAAKTGASIDWTETIEYLAWIASQPRHLNDRTGGHLDQDPDWGWASKAAVNLLSVGFEKNVIDHSLRTQAWEVIKGILDDPDPTPDDDDRSSMDPATRSMSTTRGEAMHAVIRYSLWAHRGPENAELGEDDIRFSMDSVPEAREQLEQHLDPDVDPSPAVRAVYGQWFPWLVLLDRAWAARHAGAIFPDGSPTLRDAAWGAYLAFCPVYEEPFKLLRGQYSASVERLATEIDGSSWWLGNPLERIGEHLLVMVGRGVLSWGDDTGLVRRFFENASTKDAAHAVEFAGRSLLDESQDVPGETVERFQRLWGDLLGSARESPGDRTGILTPFGWWFVSRRFEEGWAFDQLTEVIRASGGIDPDFQVMERLADLAPEYPQRALAILKALVHGDQFGWSVFAWKDHARAVLVAALGHSGTRPQAQAMVHELGAKGHLDFRGLLEEQTTTAATPADGES